MDCVSSGEPSCEVLADNLVLRDLASRFGSVPVWEIAKPGGKAAGWGKPALPDMVSLPQSNGLAWIGEREEGPQWAATILPSPARAENSPCDKGNQSLKKCRPVEPASVF